MSPRSGGWDCWFLDESAGSIGTADRSFAARNSAPVLTAQVPARETSGRDGASQVWINEPIFASHSDRVTARASASEVPSLDFTYGVAAVSCALIAETGAPVTPAGASIVAWLSSPGGMERVSKPVSPVKSDSPVGPPAWAGADPSAEASKDARPWLFPNGWPIRPVLTVTNKLADKGAIEPPKGLPLNAALDGPPPGVGLIDIKPDGAPGSDPCRVGENVIMLRADEGLTPL